MSGYGEPSWVNPGNSDANTPTEEAETGAHVTAPQTKKDSGKGKGTAPLMGMSVLNIALAAMMVALGVLTIIEVHKEGLKDGDLSEPFLATYMIMFAALLGIYEFMWWMPVPHINKSMRRNFGFLYGLLGKGLYLIFVACLCLGLGTDAYVKELNWATGILFLVDGCLHVFVVFFRKELALKYQAPTAGLTADDTDENNVV